MHYVQCVIRMELYICGTEQINDMNGRIMATILSGMLAVTVQAQDRPYMEDLPYYVENLEVFGCGQEEGRAFHLPENSISLNGKWKFLYA